ncbi:Uncharacterized protein OBRU01_16270 [Operophtera brumata]|uniref:Uncharacterized protein n=1 Tax=Operophtera brumata TaxID=104452 RepID=A0A0L7L3I3_OPEBR|nr:Uncharacterized protein OBRU01_16270 [Operophtera brumata]
MLAVLFLHRMSTKRRLAVNKRAASTQKLQQKGPEIKYCRTCLATEGLVPIFYSKETEVKRTHDLELITGMEIKMNDGLSQMICSQCTDAINSWLRFRRVCRKAEKALLRMASGSPPKETRAPRKKRPARLAPVTSYKCATCHKEFRMKATYKAHMRFHTNFCVCEIHERRHTGERPYVCDHCGATFHRRSNLVQHIAIHLPEKNWQRPYVCDHCGETFHCRSYLVQHIAIHLPEKNWQKFLQIHKHNAHTGKRYGYLCGVCAHRFEKPNKVRAHTRRVHGVPDDQQGPITRVQLNIVRAHTRRVHGVPDDQQGPITRVQL